MKVIFTDFDGMINPQMKFSSTGDFSKICCQNLNIILKAVPEAVIVVSSSWRTYGLAACKDILKGCGIDPDRVIDITPGQKKERGLEREHHIEEWLRLHPETDTFVILDDELEAQDLKSNYVQTNSVIGLTSGDSEKAIKILNKDNKLH